jgi:quercetin dioxygenase-like cupin family protein
MEALLVNADRSKPALEFGATLPWLPSPEPGVARKLLERVGGEVALATSIVRYDAGSRFARHRHDLGEEFLVLKGVFSDEHGDFGEGTYVHNPPGSSHAPFSNDGCVIFVKLRQMTPDESERTVTTRERLAWSPIAHGGERAELYRTERMRIALERLPAGAQRDVGNCTGGEEIFVVDGEAHSVADPSQILQPWTWLRRPSSDPITIRTCKAVTLWVKQGHLV